MHMTYQDIGLDGYVVKLDTAGLLLDPPRSRPAARRRSPGDRLLPTAGCHGASGGGEQGAHLLGRARRLSVQPHQRVWAPQPRTCLHDALSAVVRCSCHAGPRRAASAPAIPRLVPEAVAVEATQGPPAGRNPVVIGEEVEAAVAQCLWDSMALVCLGGGGIDRLHRGVLPRQDLPPAVYVRWRNPTPCARWRPLP